MDTNRDQRPPSYATAGVDEQREQDVFARAMRPWLARTAARSSMVTSISGLSSGYFATILQLQDGPPLALSTDGVGTKILLAREANRWEPIGIDCVANNVNDLICVGAVPLALLDYVATDRIDEGVLEEIARGLYLGADLAGIAIPGGEIAQIGSMLADPAGGRPMLDLVGTAIGALPAGRSPIDGSGVRAGDVIIGLPSSGLHSNGYSLARHVLFERGGMTLSDRVPGTARHLDDALLQPTRVYVAAVQALWAAGVEPRGLVNISGGGLLNFARLAADVSYELDALPPPPPVFALIAEAGGVSAATMYATFNMGTGFGIVIPAARQQAAMAALKSVGEEPARVGWVTGRPGRVVSVPSAGLRGRGDAFETVLALRGVRPPAPPGKARYRLSHGSPCVRPVPRPRIHR
jgi:phosphoribosylformylglycinamidine cyclo-ligase